MMKAASALEFAVDRRLEGLSGGGDPVDNGGFQSLCVICAGGIDPFLYLKKGLGSSGSGVAKTHEVRDHPNLFL